MNTTAQPSTKSFFDEITSRTNALTPEQIVAPVVEREEDVHVVGIMSDDLKRLVIVVGQIGAEHNALAHEAEAMISKFRAGLDRSNPLKSLRSLMASGPSEEDVTRMEEIMRDKKRLNKLHRMLTDVMWFNARSEFPELIGKAHVGIGPNWSLHWSDDIGSDMIFEVLGGENLPPHLKRMVDDLFGSRGSR